MNEVLLTCTRCREEVAIDVDAAILRMDVEPRADAELLFCCPMCGRPGLRRVVGDLLTLLLFVGVEPLRLSEPTLPASDILPGLPAITRDDLLAWHELLADINDVSPWDR